MLDLSRNFVCPVCASLRMGILLDRPGLKSIYILTQHCEMNCCLVSILCTIILCTCATIFTSVDQECTVTVAYMHTCCFLFLLQVYKCAPMNTSSQGSEYQHRKKPRAGGGDLPYVTNIAMCQHFGQDNMLGATVNVKPAESFEDLTGEYELMKSADFSESA